MKRCRPLSWILAALFLSIIVTISHYGRGEAGEGDDLVAKLRSADPRHPSTVDELRRTADDKTVNALMKIVEARRDDWKLQMSAIQLLGEIANPIATDLLIKVVTDHFFTNECPALKWSGIIALGNFRNDPRVVDAILYRLNENTLYLREAVIQSLGRIGNKEVLPYLISALEDKSFAVRMSAVKALGTIKDARAIPFLLKMKETETEPLIREEALKAVKGLTER